MKTKKPRNGTKTKKPRNGTKTEKPRNQWYATEVVVMVRHCQALTDAEAHEWVRGALQKHGSKAGVELEWATALPPVTDA